MNIVVLTSALPVTFGTPRQRISAALRRDLSRLGEVTFVTVDCWGSEWPARRKRAAIDRFFPHARPDPLAPQDSVLSWPQRLPRTQSYLTGAPDAADCQNGWMNARRAARLAAAVQDTQADVILVADEMLWDAARRFLADIAPIVALDTGVETWSDNFSTRNVITAQWLQAICTQARDNRAALTPDAVIADAAPHLRIAQEKSDLFMEKSNRIVVLACGISWIDEITLQNIEPFWAHLTEHHADSGVSLALIGFHPEHGARFPGAEFHLNQARLHTAIGVARCLLIGHTPPWMVPVVKAALSVGTCVLMTPESADIHDLAARTGVFTAADNQISAALAEFAFSPMVSADLARDIAAEAAATDAADATAWLADVLTGATGRDITVADTPAPLPTTRRSPLAAPLEVLYEPVKQMLLVRADIHGWSHLEDLRLITATGKELTRLAPNAHQQAQPRYLLEGGLVVGLDELGSALRIEGYCDRERLFSHVVERADFQQVTCGIVTVDLQDGGASGTFWINSAQAQDRWFVQAGHDVTAAFPAQGRAITDLGVHLVPFRTPSHSGPKRRQTLTLLHQPAGSGRRTAPPQSVFTGAVRSGADRPLRPDIAALKDVHAGKRAWVIGNGPSVRYEDLARIPDGDIVFCFNRFYLSYGDTPLREDYVISADTLMIDDFGQEMIDIAHGLPLFCMNPNVLTSLRGDFIRLEPGVSSVPDFSFDPARYVTVGGSSVFVALQMAWHMGLRDIALYGMDYSFSATLTRDPRYPFPVAHNDDNHFIKGYRDAKPWCPPTWRDISAGFLNARLAFEQTGGRIVNTTRGGKLELFERVDFDMRLSP